MPAAPPGRVRQRGGKGRGVRAAITAATAAPRARRAGWGGGGGGERGGLRGRTRMLISVCFYLGNGVDSECWCGVSD